MIDEFDLKAEKLWENTIYSFISQLERMVISWCSDCYSVYIHVDMHIIIEKNQVDL
uniref:Uncharacterized protein n=1 Tax=Rhizophora mucronata TaxID=61149 RepID=A0A2P2QAL1_RHIMU